VIVGATGEIERVAQGAASVSWGADGLLLPMVLLGCRFTDRIDDSAIK
jgi:hypothetical protein